MNYKCSIIANPEGKSWNFAKKVYENLKERDGKYELNEVSVKKFRDGELKPKIKDNIRRKNCFFIHDSTLPPCEWLTQLALINGTMKNSSAQEINDVLPYLAFSRQDRKDESRVPISSKVVADIIGLYANRVLTIDVHNPAIEGDYKVPFDNLHSFKTVIDYLNKEDFGFFKNTVIMSPDVGGAKRARSFAKRVGINKIAIGNKNREEDGEVESIQIIGHVKNKNVLMVDDILDSGNTIIQAYNAVKEKEAEKISAYAPHGLFTKGVKRLTDCLDLVIIGDIIYNPDLENNEKVKIVSFAPLFAEAIYRINEGHSLSELFD